MSKTIPQKPKKGVNPFAAAVTGAIVGAGVVAAGVVALRDKKNQKKANDLLTNVKNKAKGYIKEVEAKVDKSKAEVKKVADSTSDSKKEVKKIWQK